MKFSDEQIQQLKEIFPTKDDLRKSLAPIKREIKSMKATLNLVIGHFNKRINHLEKHFVHPPGRADN